MVITQYNPYERIANFATAELVDAVDAGVLALNAVIANGTPVGSYTVVDSYGALTASEENPYNAYFASAAAFNLDFHLNALGHQMVASAVCEALDGAAPEPAPGPGFTDVAEDAWYHDVVQWATSVGAMTGYGDGTFGPADPLSRAHLATVLWRMAGEPESSGALLPDCDADAFYAGAAAWALETGLFTGYEDGTFGPADNINREQVATVMWRAAGSPEVEADLSAYPDADDVSEFAQSAMNWAVASGVISGQGNGVLDPQGVCARADFAMILMRMSSGE